ncbi:unnamed protein product [Effrenium voratum]|uniref:Uncharacterized protein n=1 Tax=Effrenium voratum TaxID=2562239 RepID=A0AA36J718_9DINO|nr:unnamed protein product [Effrenium voratum]
MSKEIEKRWGAAVAAGVVDYEGDNPSYPERVRLKTKDFFQEFDEAAVTNQCRKEGAVSKGDAAVANLAATLEAPEEALQLPVSVSAKAKAAAKDGQGPGKGSGPEHSEVAGANTAAFAVERLKAFEQWAHQFEVVLLMPFRKNYDTLNAQVAELDTSESELLEEYKKLVKERLDVAGAALVEAPSKVQEAVKIGESKYKEHDAKIASCAGQLKLKPCAQPDCLCSFGSLALRILSLKTAETQDDLQTIINVIAGGSTALKQLNSAVSTAMQEVLKAVKDCRQREKLRKKQEADTMPKRLAALEDDGGPGVKEVLLFSDQASFLKNRDENADELWAAPWVLHDEASLKSALTSDAAVHGRFMMFSSQFESSAPAQKHGRAFLKIQDGTGTQVAQILTEMQGDSMAKMCKDGQQASERVSSLCAMALVGVLGGQQTVSVAETPRFLLVLEGGLDMLIMPLQTYLSVCSNLGPATDWTAWLNGAYLLEHLTECFETQSMRRIVLTEYDLLYVPPMSMVWEVGLESKSVFLRSCWCSWRNLEGDVETMKQILAMTNWGESEKVQQQMKEVLDYMNTLAEED